MSIGVEIQRTAGQGQSPRLWQHLPSPAACMENYGLGTVFQDNFTRLMSGTSGVRRYTHTAQGSGTFALDDAVYGVALATAGATTQAQGINVQAYGGSTGEIFLPSTSTVLAFEARIKVATFTAASTGPEFFLGLAEIDTAVISGSAVDVSNAIGWSSITNDGVLLFYGEKAGTPDTNTGTSLADDTWIRLGFLIEVQSGVLTAKQFVNGVQQVASTDLAAANIPLAAMVPTLVCQADGTINPVLHIDWWQCIQTR